MTRGTVFRPRCSHCGTERIVMPLEALRGAVRAIPRLVELRQALEQLREWYDSTDYVSLCPGCFCITGDPAETRPAHAH